MIHPLRRGAASRDQTVRRSTIASAFASGPPRRWRCPPRCRMRVEGRGKAVDAASRLACAASARAPRLRARGDSRSRASVSSGPRSSADRRPGWPRSPRQALRERNQMAGEIAAVDRGDVFRLQRAQIAAYRTSCRNGRESVRSLSIVANVASSRSSASNVPSQPKSRAATIERRYKPDIGRRGAMRDDRIRGPPGNCRAAACCLPR